MAVTIKSENWDGATPPAMPTGWDQYSAADGHLITSTDVAVSGSNCVKYVSGAPGYSMWQTKDAANGAVQISTKLRWAGTPVSSNLNLGIIGRFNGGDGQLSQVGGGTT